MSPKRSSTQQPPKKLGRPKKASLAQATTEKPRGITQATSVRLPLAYLHILDSEAARLSVRRGVFLQLLLQRKRGEMTLERAKDAETYGPFSHEELVTTKLYLWYITPEIRKAVDEDRLHMGLQSISAWITQMLNQWIGRPGGLRSGPEASRR